MQGAFYCLHNVNFHVLGAAITASVLPSDGAMTVKTVESVEIGFRSRWTSVEVVNSRDGHRSTWFRSKWKSVEVTHNRLYHRLLLSKILYLGKMVKCYSICTYAGETEVNFDPC